METKPKILQTQIGGDTRPYIKNCAEEVHEALTAKI